MTYNLELEKAVAKIKENNAKMVCIQLPDGLKPKADIVQKEIEEKTGANVLIWADSCYGACDMPVGLEKLGVDMLISWGHSEWRF